MARMLNNWTYKNVVNFLEENGFSFYEDLGHAQSWAKLQGNGMPDKFVEIKFTQGFYTSKALDKMIRQSAVDQNKWIKWASS